MADAGVGLVVKAHVSELDVMYDAGDDVAHAGHADVVALLQKPCWPPRMYNEKNMQQSERHQKFILQATASSS
jgi:hypothetical protein